MCGVIDLAFQGPPVAVLGVQFAISSLFRVRKWAKQLKHIYMQSELITFVTTFTACGAAVFSGQTEEAPSLFLCHIYDPMFLCYPNTLEGLTALTPWHPQTTTKKPQQSLFFHVCLEVKLVYRFTGVLGSMCSEKGLIGPAVCRKLVAILGSLQPL